MYRSLFHRLRPLVRAQIERNRRLLRSAAEELSSDVQTAVYMTDNCVRRLKELNAKEESLKRKMLRLSVETGGCSGFQYSFLLDEKENEDDRIFEKDGVKLVVDSISYDFVSGATVDYVDEMIRSSFQLLGSVCLGSKAFFLCESSPTACKASASTYSQIHTRSFAVLFLFASGAEVAALEVVPPKGYNKSECS